MAKALDLHLEVCCERPAGVPRPVRCGKVQRHRRQQAGILARRARRPDPTAPCPVDRAHAATKVARPLQPDVAGADPRVLPRRRPVRQHQRMLSAPGVCPPRFVQRRVARHAALVSERRRRREERGVWDRRPVVVGRRFLVATRGTTSLGRWWTGRRGVLGV